MIKTGAVSFFESFADAGDDFYQQLYNNMREKHKNTIYTKD